MSNKGDTGKPHRSQATGNALETVKARSGQAELTLFAGCFCPFVQRVWVALEYYGIEYHVCHVLFSLKPSLT